VQSTYAQLLLGRVSLKQGRERSVRRYLSAVLASPSDVTDEFGVALWSYAAANLLGIESYSDVVLARVADALDSARWYSPSQLYLFRRLVDTVAATAADSVTRTRSGQLSLSLENRIATTENVIALERELASLPIMLDPTNATQRTWAMWDRADWLVGVSSPADAGAAILLAVGAGEIFENLDAVAMTETATAAAFETNPDSDGELLGAEFPGLRVHFAESVTGAAGDSRYLRHWFYLMVILLLVSVTLFGAYLLWRDVQRELATAEMRSRFVSSVSHELKTPLTAIRMFAETLRLRSTKPETQAEYLDTIVSESERLSRLLNNVLDFAKIERGAKVYHREPLALGEIVSDSARAMKYPLEQSQFKLHVNINDGLPAVSVDRDAIEQAILNLIANAMKYSGDSKDIQLTLEKVGREAVIEVVDRGVGVSAEEQKRVFEQFYRAKTEENQHIPGTGLGLTLVDHIAKNHDGYVTIESEPGKGSKFAIHLPLEGSMT
jgi:signal transduction histidine kinase